MKEDYGSKLKSILVVMTMLLAAFTAGIVMFGSVSAVGPDAFSITAPADNAIVIGIVNITWDASVNYTHGIVKIDGVEVANTTNTYYNWDTAGYIGNTRTISVMGRNSSDWANNTYATNDNISVYVFGIPGVTAWEGGRTTVGYNVLNTSTNDLKYDVSNNIVIEANYQNASWGAATYYLYYPVYDGSVAGGNSYNLTWKKYGTSWPPEISPGDTQFGSGSEDKVYLNHSGLWLIDNDDTHDASSNVSMNATIPAWFWVNTTTDYGIALSPDDEFEYDDDGSLKVTVTQDSIHPDALIAIFAEYNNRLVGTWNNNELADVNGEKSVNKNSTVFTWAGNWTATAYWDNDTDSDNRNIMYRAGDNAGWRYYNKSYGNTSYTSVIVADYYGYSTCGPWDPPEFNATYLPITVKPGVPNIRFINVANATQYLSFEGRIDINVTDSDGAGIAGLTVEVLNETGDYPKVYSGIDETNGNYSITANWSKGGTGTWTIVVSGNKAGDVATEEWNGTIEFTVTTAPGLQIKVINDGDGDNDLEVHAGPPVLPGVMPIVFQVVNASHGYYGKDNPGTTTAAMANITISGDACLLSGKTLKELDEIGSGIVSFSDKNWTVNIIPRMDTVANGGGEITISATWDDPGAGTADPVTIHIGGSSFNGSIVSISLAEITIDKNTTLTVTVTDPEGYPAKYADVQLYYINDSGECNHMIAKKTQGDSSGNYEFHFNRTQQTTNQTLVSGWSDFRANRYIAVYAKVGTSDYGYAYAKLVPNHNFKVTVEACNSPGTTTMMAGRDYNKMYFNVSIVDSTGNVTGYPTINTNVQNRLYFRLYNETGHNVTDTITTSPSISSAKLTLDGTTGKNNANHSLTGSNHYIITPGTYTVYAWNNTYDTRGNNATLEVKRVEVTCDPAEFIWKYDKNISATITVKYEGELINGTLRIDNMTDKGKYNLTWTNTSFDGTSDNGGNVSIELTKNKGFVNGVVTVSDITANYLAAGKAYQNITFWFKPEKSDSKYARASGTIPVKIPDVEPSPSAIPVNKLASLEITVTGRGDPLEDVWVSIVVPSLTGEQNSTTDSDGKVTFSFTPPSTGNIQIKIENRTSDTVVKVTSWSLYLDIPASANENSSFIATVRNGSATGAGVADATVTFNKGIYITGSDGTTEAISTPSVTDSTDYTITATKEGYAEASDTIKVLNVPKLFITLSGTTSPVTVTVYSDAGDLITGATVTFGTITATTVNGQATITVEKDTTGTMTATFAGFQDATPITVTITAPGIPGFELLTLLAAIGVAFILLRRRRH